MNKPTPAYLRWLEKQNGLPPGTLGAVIKQESGGNQNARSSAGAIGLMQLMPDTARGLHVNPYDAMQNLQGGARYLAEQYHHFGSLPLALSAYNSGPGGSESSGRIEGNSQTQGYVKNIMSMLGGGGAAVNFNGGGGFAPAGGGNHDFVKAVVGSISQGNTHDRMMALQQAVRDRHRTGAADMSGGSFGSFASGSDPGGLNPDFSRRLAAFEKATGVSVNSGYRSTQEQAVLWANALKKYGSVGEARKWVAPPGGSNHNKGLAADLRFPSAAARARAHQLASRYGLTFPLGNEPWHIEPLGIR